MYDELFAAWQQELESTNLSDLPSDFYARVADYLSTIIEGTKLTDKKSIKSKLLELELERVKCMLQELIWTRYKKLVSLISESQKLPSNLLTDEEKSFCERFVAFAESYQTFVDKLLRGQISIQISKATSKKVHKRIVLRFVKTVPAVIGADMKTYGPFEAEDVASLPIENAKILVKQGLAKKVELS